jgi:hypothetical protein
MPKLDPATPCLDAAPAGRRDAARHEAGHVLLAYLGRVAIQSVQVSDAGTGRVVPDGNVGDAPTSWLRSAVAGLVGQALDLAGPSPHIDSDDGKLAYQATVILKVPFTEATQAARVYVMEILALHRCHHALLSEYLCNHHNTRIEWSDLSPQLDRIFEECEDNR